MSLNRSGVMALGPLLRLPAVCLGSIEGVRWGNSVYQLMFILSYARQHGLPLYALAAHGFQVLHAMRLYDTRCPFKDSQGIDIPRVIPAPEASWGGWFFESPSLTASSYNGISGNLSEVNYAAGRYVIEHFGFFQYHTSGYAPHREFLQLHFRPTADIEAVLFLPVAFHAVRLTRLGPVGGSSREAWRLL